MAARAIVYFGTSRFGESINAAVETAGDEAAVGATTGAEMTARLGELAGTAAGASLVESAAGA